VDKISEVWDEEDAAKGRTVRIDEDSETTALPAGRDFIVRVLVVAYSLSLRNLEETMTERVSSHVEARYRCPPRTCGINQSKNSAAPPDQSFRLMVIADHPFPKRLIILPKQVITLPE
jgi:hypothetical protein